MNNNLSRIKQKISSGKLVKGTHMIIGEPIISEILCNCGFDLIWLDGEHGAMDKKDLNLLIMTILGKGVAPFVRVPWNDPVLVKPILEMGPAAIIFPFIKTVEEAKKAVASCKYPPKGVRGFGPHRAIDYGAMDVKEYLKLSENYPWVILQIEHIDGVNNLEDIIKVEGVDSIVVGPNDLSGSIGLLGQTNHADVKKLLNRISEICNKHSFPFGISMGMNKNDVVEWIKRGASWIVLEKDASFVFKGGKDLINTVKKLLKENI